MEDSIKIRVRAALIDFIRDYCEELNVNFNEVIQHKVGGAQCLYKLTRGKNKGERCKLPASSNGLYCVKHVSSLESSTVKEKDETEKTTKVELIAKAKKEELESKIRKMLETAIPQEETILKKTPLGLLDENTDMLFTDEFVVKGKVSNGKVIKLTEFDVNICEQHGWIYDENTIDFDYEED